MVEHAEICGTGPVVVLIHGVGLDRTLWAGVVARLAPRFTCVALDLPGHGSCPPLPGPLSLERYARDLLARLEALPGSFPVSLVGFSLGALIAQQAALIAPQAIDRLALLHSVYDRDAAQRAAIARRLETGQREGPGALIEAAVRRWFTEDFRQSHPHTVAAVRRRLASNDPATFLEAYRVFAQGDAALVAQVAAIACPTLVMTGAADVNSTPAMSQALATRIPGARCVILPGLAHGSPIEAPDRVAEHVRAFLLDPLP